MSPNDAGSRPEFTLEDALNEARMTCFDLILSSIRFRLKGNRYRAFIEWELAKHRYYGTGPYAPKGYLDFRLPGWRDCELGHRQVAWNIATMTRSAPTSAVQASAIPDAVTDT
jgi:hypothetical protein